MDQLWVNCLNNYQALHPLISDPSKWLRAITSGYHYRMHLPSSLQEVEGHSLPLVAVDPSFVSKS